MTAAPYYSLLVQCPRRHSAEASLVLCCICFADVVSAMRQGCTDYDRWVTETEQYEVTYCNRCSHGPVVYTTVSSAPRLHW